MIQQKNYRYKFPIIGDYTLGNNLFNINVTENEIPLNEFEIIDKNWKLLH